MAEEFKRIMDFFHLNPEEKEAKMEEVFEDSIAYFERFKHIMMNGTPEEKKEAIEKMMVMKQQIEKETNTICKKAEITEEQLEQISNDPKNFSSDQWEALEHAKEKFKKGMRDFKTKDSTSSDSIQTDSGDKDNKSKKKRKKHKQHKNWIPS